MDAAVAYSKSDLELFTAERKPPPPKARRADPVKRKKEKEDRDFPEGVDAPILKNKLFSNATPDALKRLHAMLNNFLLIDGVLTKRVDLNLFGRDVGEDISNVHVQEVCQIQPTMEELIVKDCIKITDVGLWSIARHCTKIKELNLSGCHQVTNIGLRSISLRCCEIVTLNFNYCHLLDDIALTVIATGAWKLEKLFLRGCTGVSDTGVGKIAKACERLSVLDLNGCTNVGEYGDHALKEIGAFCNCLTYFDFSGCKHVEDAGFKAIAVGCTNLESLFISGCDNIGPSSIKALCKHNRSLTQLNLSGCKRLVDKDLEDFNNCGFAKSLTSLDITGGHKLTDRAVGAICRAVGPKLFHLGLPGSQITDFSSVIISNFCTRIQSLDLCRCSAITGTSIHTLAKKISALTTLKLDGDDKVTMKDIYIHVGKTLEFADMATRWLGYQPKEGSGQLIAIREKFRLETAKALLIQCMVRRKFAYTIWREKRRWWLLNKIIPKFQAGFRRRQQLKQYRKILAAKYRVRMCIRIQKTFRRWRDYQARIKKLKAMRFAEYKLACAMKIQRAYWRMKAIKFVKVVRNAQVTSRLQDAKRQAERELNALLIQRFYRGFVGRCAGIQQAIELQRYKEHKALRERMMRLIQRIAHGKLGRIKAKRRRDYLLHELLRWNKALDLQRCFRGFQGRLRWKYFKELWLLARVNRSATNIQRLYRGYRGRILAAVAKALMFLRKKQQFACLEIQRWARGVSGRVYAKRYREQKERYAKERRAVLTIQRLYRGHKGREASEIERQVVKLEGIAKPLLELVRQLESDALKLGKLIVRLEHKDKLMLDDIFEIERELENANTTTAKLTDSKRINGIPQRFLTQYLRVRLKDHLEHEREIHKSKFTELQKRRREMRSLQEKIVSTRRELLPLTVGMVSDVKRQRSIRLRNLVRLRIASAAKIQAIWRGALTRIAYYDDQRDNWIECLDLNQSEKPYYFNTESHETSWRMPQSFRYYQLWKYRTDWSKINKKVRTTANYSRRTTNMNYEFKE